MQRRRLSYSSTQLKNLLIYGGKMNDKEIFEKAYEKPGVAVWTHSKPPEALIELVETGKIKPCKLLDVGCGEGFYAIYLASKGFDVLGIDISENAIKYAKENAKKAGVNIRFKVMDLRDLPELKEKFDFVLEWAILHGIAFEERQKHVENIDNLLNEKGKYFSMCFNIQDVKFTGPGKRIRIVPEGQKISSGMKMYFSPLDELKELFEPYFKMIESKVIELPGAGGRPNVWNYFLMEKK